MEEPSVDLVIYELRDTQYVPVRCVSGARGAPEAVALVRRDVRYRDSKLKVKPASECPAEDVAAARAAK
jgi:hypothetical protein